jgi:hypothetical protein
LAALAGILLGDVSTRKSSRVDDRLALSRDLVALIWQHKLWWAVPVIVALLLLSLMIVLQATPLGPLLYPLF